MKKFKFLVVALFLAITLPASAANSEPTKNERVKMAEMHTKIASCLQSDQPMSECQSDMMKSCQGNMDGKECMMMHSTKKSKK